MIETLYYGVVEDINDPEKLGRVKVRWFGIHPSDVVKDDTTGVPTDDLLWSIVMQPTMSSAMTGLGEGPHNLLPGCWVVGFFRDTLKQSSVVIGSIPGKAGSSSSSSKGFSDPSGIYPLADRVGEPDINRLARNEKIDQTIVQHKKENLLKDVPIAGEGSGSWSEPDVPYNAIYPHNKVYESPSGHITEIDDTPDHERLHEYHKSGTFREVHPDGSVVTKVVKDNYELVYGDNYVMITGVCNITVNGNVNLLTNGNLNADAKGNMKFRATGNIDFEAANIKSTSKGKFDVISATSDIKASSSMKIQGQSFDLTAQQSMKMTSQGTTDIKGTGVMTMRGDAAVNIVGVPATLNNGAPVTPATPPVVLDESTAIIASSFGSYQTAVTREVLVNEAGVSAPNDDKDVESAPIPPIKPITTGISACGLTVTTPIDYEMTLAGPFKLKHLCHTTLWYHNIPESGQNGLTAQQIICNLKALCENILIPLSAQFPGMRINSGFRSGSSRSQHNKGMAVDLSWPTQSGDANTHAMNVYNWAQANLPFDQIISERRSSMWIHISYNAMSTTQRKSVISTPNGEAPYTPGFKTYSNANTWGAPNALPSSKGGPEPLF